MACFACSDLGSIALVPHQSRLIWAALDHQGRKEKDFLSCRFLF